jgi:hypothetical protein
MLDVLGHHGIFFRSKYCYYLLVVSTANAGSSKYC